MAFFFCGGVAARADFFWPLGDWERDLRPLPDFEPVERDRDRDLDLPRDCERDFDRAFPGVLVRDPAPPLDLALFLGPSFLGARPLGPVCENLHVDP